MWQLFFLFFMFFFTGVISAQVAHDQLVPLPGFAEFQPGLTSEMEEMHQQMAATRESATYQDGQLLRYEVVDTEVMVYTTPLPVEMVREKYKDLFIDQMRADGTPEEAISQFSRFLDTQVIQQVENVPLFPGDPDMMETYYEMAEIDVPARVIDCMRELYPDLKNKETSTFVIEMNEQQFRQDDSQGVQDPFTMVEVEVQQPSVNLFDCSFSEQTSIIYRVFTMTVSIE